jgi:tocopherol cyclase
MVRVLRNPDLYHGKSHYKNYFEGWYFKIVDPSQENIYAIIPGLYLSSDPSNSHSFIQILQGNEVKYSYIKYNCSSFSTNSNKLNINIEKNNFSLSGMELCIKQNNLYMEGNLTFENILTWPDSILNPGSMGYYNYIPFMQCYSQVCAMNLDLKGSLIINHKLIDFNGGKGYIEKNWGKDFPFSWTWIQCNNFKNSKAAFSCSIGHIPFLFTSFRGFLAGLCYDNNFYKFTTMNKSSIVINNNGSDKIITMENKKYILKLETHTANTDFMLCCGPRNDSMIPLVKENLKGTIDIELYNKTAKQIIFKDTGCCTGIEYGGDQRMILDKSNNSI